VRQAVAPSLALLIVANFLGYAVMGSNGLLSWANYRHLKAGKQVELDRLGAERTRLAHHVKLLDPLSVDPDLADEMIRRDFGLIRPDEVVISRAEG
jgi:cell division protein FtsB